MSKVFQITQKGTEYFRYLCKIICHQKRLKIAQSSHTDPQYPQGRDDQMLDAFIKIWAKNIHLLCKWKKDVWLTTSLIALDSVTVQKNNRNRFTFIFVESSRTEVQSYNDSSFHKQSK